MSQYINFTQLAVITDGIYGVDMNRVNHYRKAIINNDKIEPIKVNILNSQGFYVLNDGHHRTVAHILEGLDKILAEINPAKSLDIQWRWPRIAPIMHTIELINMNNLVNPLPLNCQCYKCIKTNASYEATF